MSQDLEAEQAAPPGDGEMGAGGPEDGVPIAKDDPGVVEKLEAIVAGEGEAAGTG